jgi:hypothetical protein
MNTVTITIHGADINMLMTSWHRLEVASSLQHSLRKSTVELTTSQDECFERNMVLFSD